MRKTGASDGAAPVSAGSSLERDFADESESSALTFDFPWVVDTGFAYPEIKARAMALLTNARSMSLVPRCGRGARRGAFDISTCLEARGEAVDAT